MSKLAVQASALLALDAVFDWVVSTFQAAPTGALPAQLAVPAHPLGRSSDRGRSSDPSRSSGTSRSL